MLEIFAVIFGLLQGMSIALNKRSNWIFYIIQMFFMCAFSYQNHLYGDTVNSFIYIFLGVYGWFSWSKPQSMITYCSREEKACIYFSLALGYVLLRLTLIGTDDPLPSIDSFSTVSSIIATILMLRRKVEAWVLWFINDIIYSVEYFALPDQALYLMFLNMTWTGLAVYSFIIWKNIADSYEKDLHRRTI